MSSLPSSGSANVNFQSFDLPALMTEDSAAPSVAGTPIASSRSRASPAASFEALEAEIERLRLGNRSELPQVFTINVGPVRSKARWNVPSPKMANDIIHKLAIIVRENEKQQENPINSEKEQAEKPESVDQLDGSGSDSRLEKGEPRSAIATQIPSDSH